MIVKIHSRGKGVGTGPVEYLLGKNRDREQAVLLSGDPDQTIALIDSLDFKTKYTSGTLSFEEKDIPAEQKQSIMDSLESHLMAGLDRSQYDILWVQHQDKDRLELNFVIPNVELTTGKRINPYFDRIDRARNDAWQEITNHDYGLSDPNSPDKKRLFRFNNDLPKDKLEAKQIIHRTLLSEIDKGEIANRADIIKSLESKGVEVSRQTKIQSVLNCPAKPGQSDSTEKCMNNLLNQAQEFEKKSKQNSANIAKSVNNEFEKLETFISKRTRASANTIEKGISQNEEKYQTLLNESISEYEKRLNSAQLHTSLILTMGIIIGMLIPITAILLLHKFSIINLSIG